MKLLSILRQVTALFFVLLLMASSSLVVAKQQKPLCLYNAVIIDGNGGVPVEDGAVVIRGNRIDAVGIISDMKIPPDARMMNMKGKTVMPGLADMHVHLCGGWDGMSVDMLGYQRYFNSLLYSGVTTVLDLGNSLEYILQLRQEVKAGRILGPRIYCAGPIISGTDPSWPSISYSLSSRFQIPKLIGHLKNANVDVVKIYSGLSHQMVDILANAAKKESLRVFVHSSSSELLECGIAAYAHMFKGEVSDNFVKLMRRKNIHCVTTLSVTESGVTRRLADLSFLDDPLVKDTTPPWFLKDLRSWVSRKVRPEVSSRTEGVGSIQILKGAQKNAKKLFDAGILLAAGTDAPYPGVFMGEGIHRELELLVEAGLSPLEALTVATKNAAVLMEAEDKWGTLSPGKLANILVLSGRPDKSIRQTRNVDMVILEGKILDRKQLKFDEKKDPGFKVRKLR
jgi:hypothetical protein